MTERLDEVVLDERPWGTFQRFTLNEPSTVKIITVAAGASLSLQRHEHRDELWRVLDGQLLVQVGADQHEARDGDQFFIPRGVVHRLTGLGATGGRLLEVALGHFDEDDIERLDDVYGRTV